ncbi:hypothetical protein G6F65_018573 [Rhizopus arrhizus]|nr:hypothetical protein G6F65_018573 [Rhizopus arrhizus]
MVRAVGAEGICRAVAVEDFAGRLHRRHVGLEDDHRRRIRLDGDRLDAHERGVAGRHAAIHTHYGLGGLHSFERKSVVGCVALDLLGNREDAGDAQVQDGICTGKSGHDRLPLQNGQGCEGELLDGSAIHVPEGHGRRTTRGAHLGSRRQDLEIPAARFQRAGDLDAGLVVHLGLLQRGQANTGADGAEVHRGVDRIHARCIDQGVAVGVVRHRVHLRQQSHHGLLQRRVQPDLVHVRVDPLPKL